MSEAISKAKLCSVFKLSGIEVEPLVSSTWELLQSAVVLSVGEPSSDMPELELMCLMKQWVSDMQANDYELLKAARSLAETTQDCLAKDFAEETQEQKKFEKLLTELVAWIRAHKLAMETFEKHMAKCSKDVVGVLKSLLADTNLALKKVQEESEV